MSPRYIRQFGLINKPAFHFPFYKVCYPLSNATFLHLQSPLSLPFPDLHLPRFSPLNFHF